jgi:hypothetical protein
LLREIVDVRVIASYITSMILYKTVMNMYMKNTHNNASVLKALGGPANTKTKEIAFFMIVGAPMVVGALMGIN